MAISHRLFLHDNVLVTATLTCLIVSEYTVRPRNLSVMWQKLHITWKSH